MTTHNDHPDTPRAREALAELRDLIRASYPDAAFDIYRGDDPDGLYLLVTVDIDDPDEVVDVYIDRLVDIQIEEELPIHVIPLRTLERSAALLRDLPRTRAEALPH